MIQLHTYYGTPSTDSKNINSYCTNNNISANEINAFGPLGLRIEKYVTPFNIIPETILGLGIDYSRSNTQLLFPNISNKNNKLNITHNRLLLSANLMTFVSRRCVGYTTAQGGFDFTGTKKSRNDSAFPSSELYNSNAFEYRLGYGFQYYFYKLFAFTGEIGYGGGAYFRSGVSWLLQ